MKLIPTILVLVTLLGIAPTLQAASSCKTTLPASTPDSDFTVNGDGTTVTHNPTGLMWLRCAQGQAWNTTCTDTAATFTWANALLAARNSTAAGYSDWRLPNVKELESVVEDRCHTPSVNEAIFPNTPASNFWSSSTDAVDAASAWPVYFKDGSVYQYLSKTSTFAVRLVRSGQPSDSVDVLQAVPLNVVISSSGTGTGMVTPSSGTLDWVGNSATASYTPGASVTLTAAADNGSVMGGWSGACSGTGACNVTMSAAQNVTATFALNVLAVPDAPTGVSAVSGNAQATLSFTPPVNTGSSAITGYTATCGGVSATNSASPITVTGLTNGTAYACTVKATNGAGSSVASNTVNVTPAAPRIVLNDTGITGCWNDTAIVTTGVEADDIVTGTHPRQDCRYGRDAAAAAAGKLTKVGGGSKGFDFTKIANNGTVTTADLGSVDTDWACTRDNVTGLVWEVKTTTGLRSQYHDYTWYNSNAATNGGDVGTVSLGTCNDPGRCDTEKFVSDVNAAGLCGASDWRIPTKNELMSLVDYGIASPGPTIDTTWFPNTIASAFWSASAYAGYSGYAWNVGFGYGYASLNYRSDAFRVRLVRAGQ